MAKLYFRYGAVGSAKTMNLLAAAHAYQVQDKRVLLAKPKLDIRFGEKPIRSRTGLEKEADLLIEGNMKLTKDQLQGISCVFVDEAQFLSAKFIDELRRITVVYDIPVICYGLRTDFKTHFFEGSQRLLEIADNIEEIKTTCHYCNKKAIYNLKMIDGKAVAEGPQVQLGCEELYLPVCASCYAKKHEGNSAQL